MHYIKEIAATETHLIRHAVLRIDKPLETCRFEGDVLESTKHFGLFAEGQRRGIVSLYETNSPLFETNNQFQLRGMAVLHEYHKLGYGKCLLRHCEEFIESKGGALIWFNARIIAVGFYVKMGYEIFGDAFEVSDVGQHYVMHKTIIS